MCFQRQFFIRCFIPNSLPRRTSLKTWGNGKNGYLLCLTKSFLYSRHKEVLWMVILQTWTQTVCSLQYTALSMLFFLITFNGLLQDLKSVVKLFADSTLLCPIANCMSTSTSTLNNTLIVIKGWEYQWETPIQSW